MKKIAFVSGGKDSVAMLHLMVEHCEQPDVVVNYDTGVEFKATMRVLENVRAYVSNLGIEIVQLRPARPFLYDMIEKPVRGRTDGATGYSWCGGTCRWGTAAKREAFARYLKSLTEPYEECVGIAADEFKRIKDKRYPLVEYGVSESEALRYCRSLGYSWEENGVDLYDILDRVSCWCCANKNLKELRNIYTCLPDYWEKLKALEMKTFKTMRKGSTLVALEERFKEEKRRSC